jgi:RNA polymerase sigma factor (sigma-70 family)
MATRFHDPEDWENIEPHDLGSVEPDAVSRIKSLLEVTRGQARENRESSRRKRAMALLRNLVMPTIQNRCRLNLRGKYRNDVDTVAERVFASHAAGCPFLADEPYKAWAESWNPVKGPFIVFVAVCTSSRCADWIRSEKSRSSSHIQSSMDLAQETPRWSSATMREASLTPEDSLQRDELFTALHLALAAMPQCRDTEAIQARIYDGLTAAEYAEREGITQPAASMRMMRGRNKLVQKLREMGVVSEDFGLKQTNVLRSQSRAATAPAPDSADKTPKKGER